MLESLKKSIDAYQRGPFLFVWSSLMYAFMLIVCAFAALGLFLAYFITLAVFNQAFDFYSPVSLLVMGIIGFLFVFFSNGLNASLARAYHSAFWREKTSLTKFYSYAVDKAPEMFGIMLVRDLIWLALSGPVIAIYVLFLKGVPYMDLLVIAYALFVTFVVHMFFTPAFLSAGAFGTGLFSSMKHAFDFIRKRHVYFFSLFFIFAVMWVLNFVPILQIAIFFIAYPVSYCSMIIMFESSVKIERVEE